jgi:hypothetical protein
LVLGVNLHECDALRWVGNFQTKPVVLDGIVFGMGSHATRLHVTKGQSTNVIFMHLAISIGDEGIFKANNIPQFMDERNKGKEVFASRTECNIFCLHGGKGNLCQEA